MVAEPVEVGTQVGDGDWELVEVLWVQTATIWLQVDAQEWLGQQVERLTISMALQQDAQEVLC